MTRDGLVEQNLISGEESRISQRGQDYNLRQAPEDGGMARTPGSPASPGAGRFRSRTRAPGTEWQPETDTMPDGGHLPEIGRDFALRPDSAVNGSDNRNRRRQRNSSYHGSFANDAAQQGQPDTLFPDGIAEIPLVTDFPQNAPEDMPEAESTGAETEQETFTEPSVRESFHPGYDARERGGRLQFTKGAGKPAPSGVSRQTGSAGKAGNQHGTSYSRKFTPEAGASSASGGQDSDTANTADTVGTAVTAPPPSSDSSKPSRLQFAPGETPPAASTPATAPAPPTDKKLNRLQKRADTVNARLEKAQDKLPAKSKIKRERVYDEQKNKVRRRLQIEKEALAPGEKRLRPPAVVAAPASAAKTGAGAVARGVHSQFHRKMYEVENDNAGVKAAHRAELAGEGVYRAASRGARKAYSFHKNKPYRAVEKLERKAGKANSKLNFHKSGAGGGGKAGAVSRAAQKRKIKQKYAQAYRKAAEQAGKAVKKGAQAVVHAGKAVVLLVKSNPAVAGVVALILLLVFFFFSMLSSCSNMAAGALSSVAGSSYLAEDADIDDAELAYTGWETDLREQIDSVESDYPSYDEYRYDIGEIGHDPLQLMAYLTARYENFTFAGVEADLLAIFGAQYLLEFNPEVEIRTRTVTRTDPDTGEDYEDEEEYEWHILNVTLSVTPFEEILATRMDAGESERFGAYMDTLGNRQYLITPFAFDWLPYVSSHYGWRIHPVTGVREFHTGTDIAVPAGTPILAGQDGIVTLAGSSGDYGLMVQIEAEHGLSSRYAHCSAILVTVGQEVKKGDVIAEVGSTGMSTGPHLHLEVIVNGQRINPIYFAETK